MGFTCQLGSAVVAVALVCGPASGQVRHLVPSTYRASAGESVMFHVERDVAGARAQWPADSMEWAFARGEGSHRNWERLEEHAAGARAARVVAQPEGLVAVGFDLRPREERWAAGKLAAAMARAGLASGGIAGESRVRVVESAKALVRVGEGSGPGSVGIDKTGQAAEVRFLLDPTAAPVGSDVFVRLYREGRSAAGVRGRAVHESGAVERFVTDREGIGHFGLSATGAWRVDFTSVVEGEGVDWVVYQGSATFGAGGGNGE